MGYDFDEIIDRRGTNAVNMEGFRDYIFHVPPDFQFPWKDEEFIRMWVADMEFATPPEIIQAIKDRLDRKIFGYTRIFDPAYFQAFSGWVRRHHGWDVRKEDLVTSPGVIPALYELVEYICKPDEKVLIVTPSYAYFKYAAEYNHIALVTSSLLEDRGHYTMDYQDLEAKARDPKTTLCIFCNPHNPTGRVWTPEELRRFGGICLDNGVRIISDEIHCDLLRCAQVHTPLAKLFPDSDRIITCMAPSKTFNLAGFMFANVLIPDPELRQVWNARHFSLENPLSIAAAQAAYSRCDEWHRQLRLYLDRNFEFTRAWLGTHLPECVFRISEATYLAWVNVKAYLPEERELPRFFADQAGVLLEGGDMFVADSDGYIRLNLACPKAVLERGLERITKALLAAREARAATC
ncbi:MAG: PatB family C-S lyase [Holophaga sp.]|jgi:cystathionine beta-lyase